MPHSYGASFAWCDVKCIVGKTHIWIARSYNSIQGIVIRLYDDIEL